jgi:NhaA family Na+:H+ antiporter
MVTSNKKHDTPDLGIIYAPWERTFSRVLSPLEDFINRQTTSSFLLMGAAVLAILLANSNHAEQYLHFIHTPVDIHIGGWGIEMSMHHWVNDALMAIFFFVVGLELKREILVGELADLRQATLPIVAAIGGMVVPALIFLAFNHEGDAMRGWGIPMATDIAFAVGALVMLGKRVPKSLVTFLVALAIVDDLGAVLVIALFYTENLALNWLILSAGLVLVLLTLNLSGIRNAIPYFIVAVLLWYTMLQSGVHATLAGVIGAFTVPARSKYNPGLFVERLKTQLEHFSESQKHGANNIMTNEKLHPIVETIEDSVIGVQTPLQRLEQFWHVPVAFLIIPLFAIFNAGISVKLDSLSETLTHPVMLGVFLGLLVGKFLGITGACWLAIKLGWGKMPSGASFSQLAAVSVLAGIGFTMSIFIDELAFKDHADYLLMAKTGVFAGSLTAGILGSLWLWFLGLKPAR